MGYKDLLNDEMKQAMKSKDTVRLSTIRMVKSAITTEEKKDGTTLPDEKIVDVILKEIKKRNESIEAFKKGGRVDLAEKEEQELQVMRQLFPDLTRPLSEDEVRAMIKDAIASFGEKGSLNMGKIMPMVLPKTQGRLDGKIVSRIVREELER